MALPLVETLRIEFSSASVEAENRYTALANRIEARIQEEYEGRADGFFADVAEWFGGDGEDPEAAKARELAAKDAHQYAVEKGSRPGRAARPGHRDGRKEGPRPIAANHGPQV